MLEPRTTEKDDNQNLRQLGMFDNGAKKKKERLNLQVNCCDIKRFFFAIIKKHKNTKAAGAFWWRRWKLQNAKSETQNILKNYLTN